MSRAAYVPPPSMGPGPWPSCCGKPMWFGPYGYGCGTCDTGGNRAPAPVRSVALPPAEAPGESGQLALFTAAQAAA